MTRNASRKPTPLVIDARYLRPGATGVGHYIRGILTGLDHIAEEENLQLHAFVPPDMNDDLDSFYDSLDNVERHQIDVSPTDHPANEFFLQKPIDIWMKKLGAEILFSPAFFGPVGRKPYRRIVCFHDTLCWDFPDNYPWKFRTRVKTQGILSAKSADLLVCPSPGAREQVMGHGIGDPGIVPYGIDHRIFRPVDEPAKIFPRDDKRIKIAFLASFERRKNHQILFEALQSVPAADYPFHLQLLHQATDTERQMVEELTEHLNVEIVWPGNQQEIAKAFHDADLSVLPSLAEGFGAPAIEAMACGCPTILSSTSWFRKLSGDGKRAWLADPYDSRDWADRLVDCITRKEETLQKTEAARKFVQNFTWDASAKKLMMLCRELNFNL